MEANLQRRSCFSKWYELRDRSFITSQGGGGGGAGGGGAVVLEGGYNFKTSPFLGGKFFSGKKHEGGQIL